MPMAFVSGMAVSGGGGGSDQRPLREGPRAAPPRPASPRPSRPSRARARRGLRLDRGVGLGRGRRGLRRRRAGRRGVARGGHRRQARGLGPAAWARASCASASCSVGDLGHLGGVLALGELELLGEVRVAVDVPDVQERGLLEADVHEGGLHAREHADHASLVDVADDPLLALSLEVVLVDRPVLDQGDARLRARRVDHQDAAAGHVGPLSAPSARGERGARRRATIADAPGGAGLSWIGCRAQAQSFASPRARGRAVVAARRGRVGVLRRRGSEARAAGPLGSGRVVLARLTPSFKTFTPLGGAPSPKIAASTSAGFALPDGSALKLNATRPGPSTARWVTMSFKSISLPARSAIFCCRFPAGAFGWRRPGDDRALGLMERRNAARQGLFPPAFLGKLGPGSGPHGAPPTPRAPRGRRRPPP